MSVTVNQILADAAIIFEDVGNVFWEKPEGLTWVNAGQKEIVRLKPDANIVTSSIKMAAGTRQTLPTGDICLVKINRNMGTDGNTPGKVVVLVNLKELDQQDPDWHTADSAAAVDYYAYDERDPLVFWVSPPSDGNGYIEGARSTTPDDVASVDDNINIADVYSSVLMDYVLFRGFSKNSESPVHRQRAMDHHTLFMQALGLQDQSEMVYTPNLPASARVGNMMTTPVSGG
jgi:hypothetical protein